MIQPAKHASFDDDPLIMVLWALMQTDDGERISLLIDEKKLAFQVREVVCGTKNNFCPCSPNQIYRKIELSVFAMSVLEKKRW